MTKTETEKENWYDEAVKEWGFDYSKTLTIDEVVNQLNRADKNNLLKERKMSKRTTQKAYYERAAKEHKYEYKEKMNYNELVFQLNRGSRFGQNRWSATKSEKKVIIKCEGETVVTLSQYPQYFTANYQAQPVTTDPNALELDNEYFDDKFVGFGLYELAIVYHFLRKENWDNWFKIEN